MELPKNYKLPVSNKQVTKTEEIEDKNNVFKNRKIIP
jgi:hypothetical protein